MAVSRNVTVIPAIKRIGNNKNSESKPKIRVAAYCRVSTDSEEQASSYDIQIEHYTNYIKKNKEWELAGIFADDGITGTNTKKRDEFNRMIEECMAGNIDMIITKSISRFARNTLDCLKYIRQLKDKNIAVFFEKENINTLDSKGEIMLTIMASLAQQESQSLSQNVKLGIQYRYQQGEVQVNHKRFLGYTKDENKQLVIDPEGAEVVKRIYREYLEGASLLQIARGLEADGILTAAGKAKWRPETLKKILQNENTSVMPFYKKHIRLISFLKSESRITASFPSIMWKTAMSLSFHATFLCRFKKRWFEERIFGVARAVKREYIAVSMLYRVLFTADSAVIFTDGYIGITEDTSQLFGDASAVWRRRILNALPLP